LTECIDDGEREIGSIDSDSIIGDETVIGTFQNIAPTIGKHVLRLRRVDVMGAKSTAAEIRLIVVPKNP